MTKIICEHTGNVYRGSVLRDGAEKFCIVSANLDVVMREIRIYLGVKRLVGLF
jgi:hypothetical protein